MSAFWAASRWWLGPSRRRGNRGDCDRLVVSSDDPEVLRIAAGYDPALALERPAALAGDESLAIDFVRHALSVLETQRRGTV